MTMSAAFRIAIVLLLVPTPSLAGITGEALSGADPRPDRLGPYDLLAFPPDEPFSWPSPYEVTEVAGPTGDLLFSVPMSHRRISQGWAGYCWDIYYPSGDIYYSQGLSEVALILPPDTAAFLFYFQHNGGGADVTATADDGTEVVQFQYWSDCPAGFGFYSDGSTPLISITVSSNRDFAIGEFFIAPLDSAEPCEPQWLELFPSGQLGRDLYDFEVFDPDGDGPLAPVLVAGGVFSTAGGLPARHAAAWDGRRWSALGDGPDDNIFGLGLFDPDGSEPNPPVLVAAVEFGVWRWDGLDWQEIGDFSSRVQEVIEFDEDGPGGSPPALFACGGFNRVDGQSISRGIARWDGTQWTSVGQGFSGGSDTTCYDMAVYDPDGAGPNPPLLVAAGGFVSAGSVEVNGVAAWNGSEWRALGDGTTGRVFHLAVFDPDGGGNTPPELYASGQFTISGGAPADAIARWNGRGWSRIGTNGGKVLDFSSAGAMAVYDEDQDGPRLPALFVSARIDQGGMTARGLARWDGRDWAFLPSQLPSAIQPSARALAVFDPDGDGPDKSLLWMDGTLHTPSEGEIDVLMSWDGLRYAPAGAGPQGTVHAVAIYDEDGEGAAPERLFVGGEFSFAGDRPASLITRRDGVGWAASSGLAGEGSVSALHVCDPDDLGPQDEMLIVAGDFISAGGRPAGGIAGWDGIEWSTFGAGTNGTVLAIISFDPDGDDPIPAALIAAGDFTVAGDVPANHIARWNGFSWEPLGAGLDGAVLSLTVFDEDGDGPLPAALFAGGDFEYADTERVRHLARWDGSEWSSVGGGVSGLPDCSVNALTVFDPDYGGPAFLVAGGGFVLAGDVYCRFIAAWDGSEWSPLGDGFNTLVHALTVFDYDGTGPLAPALYAGGEFLSSGGMWLNRIARWDGDTWLPLAEGIGTWIYPFGEAVFSLSALDIDGPGPEPAVLFAGGRFESASGVSSSHLAAWGCANRTAPFSGYTSPRKITPRTMFSFQRPSFIFSDRSALIALRADF